MTMGERILKQLASLKLAVVVILLLGVLSAVGTIYEAKFDAYYAQEVVYRSIYMYLVMGLLCINLVAVMVDRWPWKPHHFGFVFAHIGIIILLLGSYLTQKLGIDGSLALEQGRSGRWVSLNDRELSVYSSFDGNEIREIRRLDLDFLRHPPSKEKPKVIDFGGNRLEILEYHHFADRLSEIVPSSREADGPALRFHLSNDRVNVLDWLRVDRRKSTGEKDLGPAKVVLSKGEYLPKGDRNEIVVEVDSKGNLSYLVFSQKEGRVTSRGPLSLEKAVETGWMGLKFVAVRFLPQAIEKVEYKPRDGASPMANSAIRVRFEGEDHWIGLNSVLRLFSKDTMFMVAFANRRIDLGFELNLKEFRIGRYQGTRRAMSYESEVIIPGGEQRLISMNNPLKYEGFTFYQASFEENERGEPVASILSVNHDPGRAIKYAGSFILCLGIIILFYFKKIRRPKGSAA